MHLTRLALTDFRSYAAADLSLGPGVSTLLGANGQGKTNFVEAAAYVATLGSHRVAGDAPLVRRGAERAILRAAIASPERDSLVEIEINPGRANRARVNRVPVPRPRQVLGVLRTVLFAPEDLAVVKNDPEQRRRYLDELLVASAPRYAGVRADYERVVRQRTALLKSARARSGSRALARAGRARSDRGPRDDRTEPGRERRRRDGAGWCARRLGRAPGPEGRRTARGPDRADGRAPPAGHQGRTPKSPARPARPSIVYRQSGAAQAPGGQEPGPGGESSDPGGDTGPGGDSGPRIDRAALADGLREALARARPDELERGVCLVGPHRDELELRIGDLPARGYASHGESWSMALALRLAGYELLRADGDDPVLILDDVFAELDSGRRERLASLVGGAEQVLVTAAVPADVPAMLAGVRFEVAGGVITRA